LIANGATIRRLEIEGFAVFPAFLGSAEVAALRKEFATLDLIRPNSAKNLWCYRGVHESGRRAAIELVAHPLMLPFLKQVLGDDLVCMSTSYARYDPGYMGMPLHTDSQPYGSKLFGPLASVPVSLRVFYYLDEITPERSPFRVIPCSHLCLHQDANPYRRWRSHPEEVTVTGPAGTAVLINQRVFHGAGPNRSAESRAVYTVSYRPLWAGPVKRVPGKSAPAASTLPDSVRELFRPLNVRKIDSSLPIEDSRSGAPPLGVRRWEWKPGN
jgi:ectoine hydroxylase-related dioxygenase (phytanoyl-CoA dioxygenase family)